MSDATYFKRSGFVNGLMIEKVKKVKFSHNNVILQAITLFGRKTLPFPGSMIVGPTLLNCTLE